MERLKYQRGSEWRRWDLHVHTPFSYLNNGFGGDFDNYAKILFETAIAKEIAVIGITDYFLVDGYKQLKALQQDKERIESLIGPAFAVQARDILLLPNIEFRLDVLIDGNRVNCHVILSDEIDVTSIEEDFLRDVKFTYESSAGNPDDLLALTRQNLEALGRKLKENQPEFRNREDVFIGMMNAVVSHEKISEVLERQPSRFKDKYIFLVSADEDLSKCKWNGQGHQTRKLLVQKSHILFSANPSTRDFGLGLKDLSPQGFIDEFGSLKPCIHGSDAHTFETLFEPDLKRYQWIKADPTFHGLRQLLHMPADRAYIGENHPTLERQRANATKYFDYIQFERLPNADEREKWFDSRVEFNHGLVAIIGNKGSGKSALADILGLLGNSSNQKDFSFLRDNRFLQKRAKLGTMFAAELTWNSGSKFKNRLDATIESSATRSVKYIPQNFLEGICSELTRIDESDFYGELMEVIFSHVAVPERLGKETLAELINYITEEKEGRVVQIAQDLKVINAEVSRSESMLEPENKRSLEAQIVSRMEELEAHNRVKPQTVTEPSQNVAEQAVTERVKSELAALVQQWEMLEQQIESAEADRGRAAREIAAADRLITRIENLDRYVSGFQGESLGDLVELGLDIKQLVELKINKSPILEKKSSSTKRMSDLNSTLNVSIEGSLLQRLAKVKRETEETRANLDKPNKEYQEYCQLQAEWDKRRAKIIGSELDPDSLEGLKHKRSELETLPERIVQLKSKRSLLVREVLHVKRELLEDYRKLHSPVQSFIESHPVAKQQNALEFAAGLKVEGLEQGFLDMIHRGRKGSFQGEDGGKRLREIVDKGDFATDLGVDKFLQDIQSHLDFDVRKEVGEAVRLQDQLAKGKTPEDVYDFLYGLGYLQPRFELRWQGKTLNELSQGERGALLLIFYLLIDKSDVPLIIDQPEENLDNQSVVTMLVPAIKYAKERRQVIIVTHNPNLAVVCDADQIIHASLDRADGNRVTYTTGSIEEPIMTQLIVDVLEGTKPAFDVRDARYGILETKYR